MIQQYFVVPMPIDSQGRGPETDSKLIVGYVWQVWNLENETVGEYPTKTKAYEEARKMNNECGETSKTD